MKYLIPFVLVSVLFLSGCASLFPWENLDAHPQELSLATYIQTKANTTNCFGDIEHIKSNVSDMYFSANWLVNLTDSIPNNPTTEQLSQELLDLVSEINERYKNDNPSSVYCEAKMENVYDAAQRIAQAYAKKEY